MDLSKTINDQGHLVSEHMKQAEGIPVIHWDDIFDRMGEMLPLFSKVETNVDVTEGEKISLPAVRRKQGRGASLSPDKGFNWDTPTEDEDQPKRKPPQAPKKKVGDASQTRRPKPRAEDERGDEERAPKRSRPSDASDLSKRLGGGVWAAQAPRQVNQASGEGRREVVQSVWWFPWRYQAQH